MLIRLQKALSEYGIMSRRAAEQLIKEGRIEVNGNPALLGQKIDPDTDIIEIDGRIVRLLPQEAAYIMLNKPRGYITAVSDDRDRKTVMDLLEGLDIRVYPVGRLDYDSDGLLLLTNDGDFANMLMHPSYEKEKTYVVTVSGFKDSSVYDLGKPMEIEGYTISPAKVRLIENNGDKAVIEMKIHEGRNRQIRKMCEQTGLDVISLTRTAIGDLSLGDLSQGMWRYLTDSEVSALKNARSDN